MTRRREWVRTSEGAGVLAAAAALLVGAGRVLRQIARDAERPR